MNTFESAAASFKLDNWLMTAEGFDILLEIVSQKDFDASINSKSIQPHPVAGAVTKHSQGMSVIPVIGVMATFDNFISNALGWTTYESLQRSLKSLQADVNTTEILLYFDTPGGSAKGQSELNATINGTTKEITSYVAGTCASAGYWIASQTNKITASPDALIGSIGTTANYYGKNHFAVTSKNAPNKQLDQKAVQVILDDLEALFIAAVASGRGVSTDHVKQHYGKGGVMIGNKALNAGMIDAISSFGELIGAGATGVASNGLEHDPLKPDADIEASWKKAGERTNGGYYG